MPICFSRSTRYCRASFMCALNAGSALTRGMRRKVLSRDRTLSCSSCRKLTTCSIMNVPDSRFALASRTSGSRLTFAEDSIDRWEYAFAPEAVALVHRFKSSVRHADRRNRQLDRFAITGTCVPRPTHKALVRAIAVRISKAREIDEVFLHLEPEGLHGGQRVACCDVRRTKPIRRVRTV